MVARDLFQTLLGPLDRRGEEEIRTEIDEEIRSHLEHAIEEEVSGGKERGEALEAALGRFGNPEKVRRNCLRVALSDRVLLGRIAAFLSLAVVVVVLTTAMLARSAYREQALILAQIEESLRRLDPLPAAALPAAAEPTKPLGESNRDGFWEWADPEEVGIDADALRDHRDLCEATGADSCLVVHDGKILSEWFSERYRLPVHAMSSTKSITNLLVGMLLDDGKLASLESPVSNYLPSWSEGDKGLVTLRHLLSHTSGLPRLENRSVGFVSDKNAFVLELDLVGKPGTFFAYSNEGVQLLSPILDAAAGVPIQDYAKRRLFDRLGMADTSLMVDPKGHAWTYADMKTSTRDLARIGQLLVQNGRWRGEQVVSKAWIDRSIAPSQPFREDCGLLWWRVEELDGFAAYGYLDTNVYIFPSRRLVVVRTQSKPREGAAGDYRGKALALFRRMVSAGTVSKVEEGSDSIDRKLRETRELNRNGSWAEALALARNTLTLPKLNSAQSIRARISEAHALICLRRRDEAAKSLDRLRTLLPQAPRAHDEHARLESFFREQFPSEKEL